MTKLASFCVALLFGMLALLPAPASAASWHRILDDEFDGSTLNRTLWNAYDGQPGGSGSSWTGWWDPSHVEVRNGIANLRTYQDSRFGNRWVSGGMSNNKGQHYTYGKYNVMFRADAGYGVNIVMLLWPDNNGWPPEIDFGENGAPDGQRSWISSTLHYGTGSQFTQFVLNRDFTQWHCIGVEWSPGLIQYTIDGSYWGTIRGSTVPSLPMHFAAAAMAGMSGNRYHPAPSSSTTPREVDLQFDWVRAWAYS